MRGTISVLGAHKGSLVITKANTNGAVVVTTTVNEFFGNFCTRGGHGPRVLILIRHARVRSRGRAGFSEMYPRLTADRVATIEGDLRKCIRFKVMRAMAGLLSSFNTTGDCFSLVIVSRTRRTGTSACRTVVG